MNILLDTHALIWFFNDDDRLSEKVKITIRNPNNKVLVSIVSFWEMAIKMSLSKLVLDIPFESLFDECETLDIGILNITKLHLIPLKELPFVHRDPFDRLILCQAIVEDCTLVSADKIFDQYPIKKMA
ncbi:MAG: type II toxin-antitoxin system VapC family toxin [Desulfobacteraceae bacterium]|nr:type II toxin-antitoxin system VapC family toxin [Desulfobacteraceae bacterium]